LRRLEKEKEPSQQGRLIILQRSWG